MFHVIDSRAKKTGAASAVCPACGKRVQMQMIEVFDSIHLIGVPVGSFLKDHFAVCPECACVFAIDRAAYTALTGGNAAFLDRNHLHPLAGGNKINGQESEE